MRSIRVGLIALAMQAFAPGAAAQEAYVAGSAGRSSWSLDCVPSGCQRGANAWRAAAGYRFNRVVAVEAFYLDVGSARSSDFSLDGRLGATGLGAQALLGWQFDDLELLPERSAWPTCETASRRRRQVCIRRPPCATLS